MKKYLLLMLLFGMSFLNSVKASEINQQKISKTEKDSLSGSWELTYISGPRIALQALFPNKLPVLNLKSKEKTVSGNAGCNNFHGVFTLTADSLKFDKPLAMTMMACPIKGESLFVKLLPKVNNYKFENNDLVLYNGKAVLMRFKRLNK